MGILGYISVRRGLHAAVPLLLVLSLPHRAAAETITESKVKSAFLYNFAKFVTWPANSLSGPSAPFTFCTIGRNPLQGTLEEVLRGKTIDEHPLRFRHLEHADEAKGCQVLFVSQSADSENGKSPANLRLPGLLIVSEAGNKDELPKGGAMITFVLESNRVRFVIDSRAADRVGLTISSKLLSLALAVER